MIKDSTKRQLVGNPAAIVPPAWRQNQHRTDDPGSKIIISKLPADVGEAEIEVRVGLHTLDLPSHSYQELFKKTVGPLKDSFIVYNSQGRSKGIAIVSFLRSCDAAIARQKYNGHFFACMHHALLISASQAKLLTVVCASTNSSHRHSVHGSLGRPIKIEIVVDGLPNVQASPTHTTQSLLERLGPTQPTTKLTPNGLATPQ
jgi:RNA recognition motif-containing protein